MPERFRSDAPPDFNEQVVGGWLVVGSRRQTPASLRWESVLPTLGERAPYVRGTVFLRSGNGFPIIAAATNGINPMGGSRLSRPIIAAATSAALPVPINPFYCRSNKGRRPT